MLRMSQVFIEEFEKRRNLDRLSGSQGHYWREIPHCFAVILLSQQPVLIHVLSNWPQVALQGGALL